MKLLLDDRYAPLTSNVGFFEAPLDFVAETLYRWRSTPSDFGLGDVLKQFLQTHPGSVMHLPSTADLDVLLDPPGSSPHATTTRVAPLSEPFPNVLHHLEPLTMTGGERELLLETDSPWTAYFSNAIRGGDAVTPVSHLCGELNCRGLVVHCIPDTITGEDRRAKGRYGIVQFQLFAAHSTDFLNYERTIHAANDGGRWSFGAHGALQPFEQPDRYLARRIKDRFTSEMLGDYCTALGVRYFDPSFYGPRGYLLEYPSSYRNTVPMTLAEAQRTLNIEA